MECRPGGTIGTVQIRSRPDPAAGGVVIEAQDDSAGSTPDAAEPGQIVVGAGATAARVSQELPKLQKLRKFCFWARNRGDKKAGRTRKPHS